ncbi:MAG: hypothetical protein QW083_01965, partial [Methanomassiliicoccales archaeon]
CDQTFPLPQKGQVKTSESACDICGSPMIEIEIGKRTRKTCLNQDCPSKRSNGKKISGASKKKKSKD